MLTSSGAGAIPTDLSAVIHPALLGLLIEARTTLLIDPKGARACIDRATALLSDPNAPQGREPSSPEHGGLAPWQVRKVAAIVRATRDDRISVLDLANAVRLSPGHFRRAFGQSFGVAPKAYLLRSRVDRAKELMLETDDGLSVIALECGLADQAHLSRLFRRFEGEPPNAWRRRHARGPAPEKPL